MGTLPAGVRSGAMLAAESGVTGVPESSLSPSAVPQSCPSYHGASHGRLLAQVPAALPLDIPKASRGLQFSGFSADSAKGLSDTQGVQVG